MERHRSPSARALATHRRAADVHDRAADAHEQSVALHEEHAIEMREKGQPESVERAELIALRERELVAQERRLADESRFKAGSRRTTT